MQVRIILRNLGGKFCWDSSILYSLKNDSTLTRQAKPPPPLINKRAFQRDEFMTSSFIGGDGAVIQPSPPRLSVRHRPPNSMPNWEDTAEDMDNLEDLLLFIGHTSPECWYADHTTSASTDHVAWAGGRSSQRIAPSETHWTRFLPETLKRSVVMS